MDGGIDDSVGICDTDSSMKTITWLIELCCTLFNASWAYEYNDAIDII